LTDTPGYKYSDDFGSEAELDDLQYVFELDGRIAETGIFENPVPEHKLPGATFATSTPASVTTSGLPLVTSATTFVDAG
jgi:hypothetical protein